MAQGWHLNVTRGVKAHLFSGQSLLRPKPYTHSRYVHNTVIPVLQPEGNKNTYYIRYLATMIQQKTLLIDGAEENY